MIKKIFILCFLSSALLLTALAEQETSVVLDPSVKTGTLENGLTWYVQENDLPADRAEIRLVIRAGSVLEEENQRGLAHFLEHMAFNGTEKYPRNELVDYLQSLGMEFGPEINASTSFDQTVYKLTVNTAREGELDEALSVLEEWAFHIDLTQEEVDREKPVILEERRMGRDATGRMTEKSYPLLYPDSRYGVRLPIGLEDVVRNASAEDLKQFYRTWYRPDLMTVIAVGDWDGEATAALIGDHFSRYASPSDAPERPEYPIPDHEGPLYSIQSDDEATVSSLEITNKYEPVITDSPEGWDRFFTEQLFIAMFNNRISELLGQGTPPFINGYGGSAAISREKHLFQWGVMTNPGELQRGFRAFWTEVERVRRFGFTEGELQRAGEQVMSGYDYMIKEKLPSSSLTSIILSAVTTGDSLTSLEWERERLTNLLSRITPEEVRRTGDKWFTDRNRVISYMGPQAPREEQIRQVMIEVKETELTPYEEGKVFSTLMDQLPRPGSVAQKEYREDLDLHIWTLSNGLKVYLKQTDFKQNEILFKAISPGGASLVPESDLISAALAPTAVSESGLGLMTATELEQFLAGKDLSLQPSIDDYWESLNGFSTPEDLEYLMQLSYLYFSAPLYRPNGWEAYRSRLAAYLEQQEKDPMVRYGRMLNQTVFMDHPRSRMLTFESLKEMDYDRAYGIFRQRFFDADDFAFYFVGNLDLPAMEELLSRYAAPLVSAEGNENWQDVGLRYNQSAMERTLRAGSEERGFVSLVISGSAPWAYGEAYRLSALGDCLEDRLLETLREDYGGAYTVTVSPRMHKVPVPEYIFTVQFSCDPERTDELISLVTDEMEFFRNGGDISSYVNDVREARLRSYEENRENNGWYLYNLSYLFSRNEDPTLFLQGKELARDLTVDQIREAAQRYLDTERMEKIILKPEN